MAHARDVHESPTLGLGPEPRIARFALVAELVDRQDRGHDARHQPELARAEFLAQPFEQVVTKNDEPGAEYGQFVIGHGLTGSCLNARSASAAPPSIRTSSALDRPLRSSTISKVIRVPSVTLAG